MNQRLREVDDRDRLADAEGLSLFRSHDPDALRGQDALEHAQMRVEQLDLALLAPQHLKLSLVLE